MEVIFWGGLLRFGEAALAGAPTLLVGLFVAGVFRKLIGPENVLKLFGGTGWRSLPQSWLWGMLLPVCSIGVIPVAYELRRAGLKGGAILAFALTAPLFNPLSLLYGLTLSTPLVIISFASGSLLVVTVVGLCWDYCFRDTVEEFPAEERVPPGLKRMAAVAVVAARHMSGPTAVYTAIGLAGSIVLVVIFPFASLTDSMAQSDSLAPLKMMAVALPAYATPLNVMMQVGGMFVHGNSVGAAYVLLSLGTGANLGLIAWAWRTYGATRALAFLFMFIFVVLGIAYGVSDALYSAGDVDRPHTHAFDVYACPFPPTKHDGLAQRTWSKLVDGAQAFEVVALSAVGFLLAVGLGLRVWDPARRVDAMLLRVGPAASQKQSVLDVIVPGPVLGAVAILGLVAFSVMGCFVYFPPPEETLEDMRYVKVDALAFAASKDVEKAVKSIQLYDDLTRRLQVGYALRHWKVSEFQQAKAKVLRGRLEQLKDILESGQFDREREASRAVSRAHQRVRESFGAE